MCSKNSLDYWNNSLVLYFSTLFGIMDTLRLDFSKLTRNVILCTDFHLSLDRSIIHYVQVRDRAAPRRARGQLANEIRTLWRGSNISPLNYSSRAKDEDKEKQEIERAREKITFGGIGPPRSLEYTLGRLYRACPVVFSFSSDSTEIWMYINNIWNSPSHLVICLQSNTERIMKEKKVGHKKLPAWFKQTYPGSWV